MTKIALLFPGQGSQSVGMMSALQGAETFFQTASSLLGYDLWNLVQNGPEERLNQTELTQPALLVADIVFYHQWKSTHSTPPAYLAGHSLGEYAALVVAESIAFEDAVLLVAARGKYMQEAVLPGKGAMAAIVGLPDAEVIDICAMVAGVVSPANFNSVGQVVVAGETEAVTTAIQLAKEKGAKIAKLIPVSVPSHCVLMQSAADRLAEDLSKITIKKPVIPVIQNVDVKMHNDPAAIRQALIQQITQPVRWVETIQWMAAQGVEDFVECGPGRVLTGLNKRIL
ncbi:MAG: [acyl-carrier-protein] S-malonyltransferase [Gammaproteobacteria bacterium RIFCSPHIGHO2_12_FULL_42_13]|nr:MAG: [acyl-carrier-protein] S-malonyltransferase [Gammaproteobacteria bacterium RIFCSPHIGHO2_12_FULL_42_13]